MPSGVGTSSCHSMCCKWSEEKQCEHMMTTVVLFRVVAFGSHTATTQSTMIRPCTAWQHNFNCWGGGGGAHLQSTRAMVPFPTMVSATCCRVFCKSLLAVFLFTIMSSTLFRVLRSFFNSLSSFGSSTGEARACHDWGGGGAE